MTARHPILPRPVRGRRPAALRDVYNRELESAGVGAGLVEITVLGDDRDEPSTVRFVVAAG